VPGDPTVTAMQAEDQPEASRTIDFLRGLRVVELGDSVVSASAGLYLRGFGAEVTKVRHGPPLAERLGAAGQKTPTAYLLRFLDEGKRAIDDPPEDELKRLLERADVVICDIDGQPPPLLRRENVDQYSQTVEALNRGAWVTVSPFGLSGPYRDYRGGELVYLASGGHLAYTRSPTDGSPMKWGGWQGSLVTGDVAGRTAVIVDDMITTAGTVQAAAGAIMDAGCQGVVAIAATHGVLVGPATTRLQGLQSARIITTDSVPQATGGPFPLEVTSVAGLLADAIDSLHNERSLADLISYS